jgi:hypothetical protein
MRSEKIAPRLPLGTNKDSVVIRGCPLRVNRALPPRIASASDAEKKWVFHMEAAYSPLTTGRRIQTRDVQSMFSCA